jgi:hypothetical protein
MEDSKFEENLLTEIAEYKVAITVNILLFISAEVLIDFWYLSLSYTEIHIIKDHKNIRNFGWNISTSKSLV